MLPKTQTEYIPEYPLFIHNLLKTKGKVYNGLMIKKARLWLGIVVALVLGLIGILLASVLPLPAPTTVNQTKLLYGLLGILISLLTFGKLASWTIKTTTRWARQLSLKLASEIINQFKRTSSWDWNILPNLSAPRPASHELIPQPIILDTSSIIDARILDVAKTNFLSGLILIPDFVLTELQQVADSADPLKRLRGRHGLEIISQLKKIKSLKVEIWDEHEANANKNGSQKLIGKTVDEKLLRLAKMLRARILTCDYNLNKVGQIWGLMILNLNDLANSLKLLYLPGEKIEVLVSALGKEKDQGVGFLMDGTMVVVSDGKDLINKTAKIEVTKVLQVPAGRMIFGKKAAV